MRDGYFMRHSISDYQYKEKCYGVMDVEQLRQRIIFMWRSTLKLNKFDLIELNLSGKPQFMVFHKGRFIGFIYLKFGEGGGLDDADVDFAAHLRRNGTNYAIVRSVYEFLEVLNLWGIGGKNDAG